MTDDKNIDKLVEDTLNSMDHHEKATPRPYLLTRINSRLLQKSGSTMWDHLTSIITKPSVAMAGLIFIIILNIFIISTNQSWESNIQPQQETVADSQEFTIATTTALYDIENIEP